MISLHFENQESAILDAKSLVFPSVSPSLSVLRPLQVLALVHWNVALPFMDSAETRALPLGIGSAIRSPVMGRMQRATLKTF